MSAKLRTIVDSVSISGGIWRAKASNLDIVEYSPLIPVRRGRGNLYVLVETVGSFPDHAQVQERVVNVVKEYYRTSGSITAGIRLAIKTANAYLFEENLRARPEQRGVAGITCLVLKDQDAYIGQLGPALLYHVGRGGLRRLPKESTWLSSEKLEDVDISKHPPLGLRREIEPDLFHVRVREGDIFILASSSLAKLASDDEISSAVVRRGAYSVRENLEALAQGRDLSALIIEILSAERAPTEEGSAHIPVLSAERKSWWAKIFSVLRRPFVSKLEEQEGLKQVRQLEDEEERKGLTWGFDFRAACDSTWRTLVGLGHALGTLLVRILPEAGATQRLKQQRLSRDRKTTVAYGDKRWLWAALAIPVLVILLFVLARLRYEHSRHLHLQRIWQAAQEARASAEAGLLSVEKRVKLREALALLDEALKLKPGDKELSTERQAIQDLLDKENHVYRIFYFNELKEFPDIGSAKCQLSTVIVQGIDVYVLDLGTDRVYKYLLNDARDGLQALEVDPVLLRKGDQYGEIVVDELLDIVWAEASGQRVTGNLLILDKKGHLFEYDPTIGLKPIPIADSFTWHEPVAAATYHGNLYLLDPLANRIFKYQPTYQGYETPPLDYFKVETSANVSDAVDISINGNVYVLHANGLISKYLEGASVPFPENNLDEPLKMPSCLFASGYMEEEGYVYVADAGNQRIVQFSKGGEFIRQFRGRDSRYMDELRSLFVDEAEKKLYFTNGSKLYLMALPE